MDCERLYDVLMEDYFDEDVIIEVLIIRSNG